MGRAPCCDKSSVKKGPWSPDEDAKLKSYIQHYGTAGNWIALPQKIGLKRCGKSCRLRWLNYLRPNIKHGAFSEEEDNIICSLYITIGSRWSIIAGQLPGRTDNDIKNYWNTRLKKKLLGKHRKEKRSAAKQRSTNPPAAPPIPAEPAACFNDCANSIRNLLIRLGGSFSTHEPPLYSPMDLQLPSLINTTTSSGLTGAAPVNLGDFEERVMHDSSSQTLHGGGLDFFYDEFIDEEMMMMMMMNSSNSNDHQAPWVFDDHGGL